MMDKGACKEYHLTSSKEWKREKSVIHVFAHKVKKERDIHSYIHTDKHTSIRTHTHVYIHIYSHKNTSTYIYSHTFIYLRQTHRQGEKGNRRRERERGWEREQGHTPIVRPSYALAEMESFLWSIKDILLSFCR